MHYLGVDYHKRFSYCTLMDEKGKVVKRGKVYNNKEDLKRFVSLVENDEVRGVMEATRNWTMMYDYLEELIEDVRLAHPMKVKAIAEAKIKTDKIDSEVLAHLIRCELLPEAYVPTKGARYIRQVLRQRMFFVRIRTMIKNRIRGIIDRHPEVGKPPVEEIFGERGMKWMNEIKLPEEERKILNEEIELLKGVKERIRMSDSIVKEIGGRDERVRLLKSIPGIGDFLGLLLCYEIDEVNRFKSEKKLHSYVGLVPTTYASGNKVIHGRITRQGNKWIRWGIVEAVWPAIKSDEGLREYYNRVKERRGGNRAKIATARRLLTIVYRVLKDKREYKVRGCPDKNLAKSR